MRLMEDYIRGDGIVVMAAGDGGDGAMKTAMFMVGEYPLFDQAQLDKVIPALFPKPGVLIRCPDQGWHSNPKCTSRDQTTGWLCFFALASMHENLWQLFWAHIKRFCFCQNWENEKGGFQVADSYWLDLDILFGIGLIRGFRLWPLYPLLLVLDFFTLINSIILISKSDPDDVGDDQNHLVVMRTQRLIWPTPISWLARKIYYWFRKPTFGCQMQDPDADNDLEIKRIPFQFQPNFIGPLWWYYRASQGAPPMHLIWTDKLKGDLS